MKEDTRKPEIAILVSVFFFFFFSGFFIMLGALFLLTVAISVLVLILPELLSPEYRDMIIGKVLGIL